MSRTAIALSLSLLLPASATPLAAWGFLGHRMAADGAIRDLPPGPGAWFQGRERAVREHVNDPDRWKFQDPLEGPRHFLDSEVYGGPAGIPLDEDAARAQVGPEVFGRNGQVPWVILERVDHLESAFRAGDPTEVAFQAAILCHYVGDINVPLHATVNHNGQDTGQKGVHKRWEAALLERIVDAESWEPEVRLAALPPDPDKAPMAWLGESFRFVPEVLADDLAAAEADGRALLEGQGARYWEVFRQRQEPLVKERLSLASQRTAQMILLAWTRAGRPEAPAGRRPQ